MDVLPRGQSQSPRPFQEGFYSMLEIKVITKMSTIKIFLPIPHMSIFVISTFYINDMVS